MMGDQASTAALDDCTKNLGLNRPLAVQYLDYIWRSVQFDFGTSLRQGYPVREYIGRMFPHTFVLVSASAVVAALVGIPIGILSALKRRNPLIDYPLRIFALLGLSMPVFWLGILLLIVFSLRFDVFPLIGGGDLDGVLGIVNYLRTTDRSLPLNRGMLRPVTVDVPKGSLLNPLPFVATGVRHATGYRVSDSVLGALSQAVPARIPAAGAGQVAIVLLSHLDASTGNYKVNVLQPMQGGCGGRPTKDGIDGVNFSAGSLRNVPTESIELEAPIFVKRYMLRDEVAAGRYRGGAGVVFEFQVNTPNTVITARGMERFRFQPWGRVGAGPGASGQTLVDPDEPNARVIGKIDVLKLEPGTTVRILSPGGGGYGDPLDRDPAAVAKDVADGLVTTVEAHDEYGVVLVNGGLDVAATERRRDARGTTRTAPAFSFGKEREQYESRFPPALQDAVAAELMTYSASSRHFLKEQVFDVLAAEPLLEDDPVALRERVRAVFKALPVLATG
jgi:N-methylhydantoinase B